MAPELFGVEHILYILITTFLGAVILFFSSEYIKDEKKQVIILKCLAIALFFAVMSNRLSQVFKYDDIRWRLIIPDSFCGMTSLVLSLSVLFGKKNNNIYHFVWLLGLFGGLSTIIYPTFISQDKSFFYIPTITGLLHHSLTVTIIVGLILFKQIDITYKKWYCTLFGFTSYLTLGAFLMQTFGVSDAFHIAEPILSGTHLTAWIMAPIYGIVYAILLFLIELYKRKRRNIYKNKRAKLW